MTDDEILDAAAKNTFRRAEWQRIQTLCMFLNNTEYEAEMRALAERAKHNYIESLKTFAKAVNSQNP